MRRRIIAAALALAFVAGGSLGPAYADDLSHKRQQAEAQIEANQKAKEDLEASLEDLSAAAATAFTELQAIKAKVPAAQKKVADTRAVFEEAQRAAQIIAQQLADAQAQATTLAGTIEAGDAEQQRIRDDIGKMAREAYRTQGDVSGLAVVLDAQDADDFVESFAMLDAAQRTQQGVFGRLADLEAANRNAAARLDAVKDKVAELKVAADQKLAEADAAKQKAEAAKAALDDLMAQQTAKAKVLESQKAEAEAELEKVKAAEAELNSQLQQIIEEQRRQAAAQQSSAQPGKALPGALFANPTATNPIYVTSEYGLRLHPILGYVRLHAGIDLRDRCGQSVYAGRDGTVVWARYRSGYGNQVMLDHGWVNGVSLMSSYNHMQNGSFQVGAGQRVTAGQLLGYAGNTGTSAACHLHFEVYINGATTNPRPYLGI